MMTDGSSVLQDALEGANLEGAVLKEAALAGANLEEASLEGTHLAYARELPRRAGVTQVVAAYLR